MNRTSNDSFDARLVDIEVEEEVLVPQRDGAEPLRIRVRVPARRDPVDGEVYLGDDAVDVLDTAKARFQWLLSHADLRRLRKAHALTQVEIAHLLQLGAKTWARWESGRETPSRSLHLLILAFFEGRIDHAWLQSKHPVPGQRMPEPVFCGPPQSKVAAVPAIDVQAAWVRHWNVIGSQCMVVEPEAGARPDPEQTHVPCSRTKSSSHVEDHPLAA